MCLLHVSMCDTHIQRSLAFVRRVRSSSFAIVVSLRRIYSLGSILLYLALTTMCASCVKQKVIFLSARSFLVWKVTSARRCVRSSFTKIHCAGFSFLVNVMKCTRALYTES